MASVGEMLYEIVARAYPELAPKLTGMLLQLGEDECWMCLEDDELLAKRLDEALVILDNSGQCGKPAAAKAAAPKPPTRKEPPAPPAPPPPPGQKQQAQVAEQAVQLQQHAPLAPAAPASAPKGAPPSTEDAPANAEAMPGLRAFLRILKLDKYAEVARAWAEENGAVFLDEVLENADDFCEALALKPLERKRLENQGEAAAEEAKLLTESQEPAAATVVSEPPAEAEAVPAFATAAPPAAEPAPVVEDWPELGAAPAPKKGGGPAPVVEDWPELGAAPAPKKGGRRKR